MLPGEESVRLMVREHGQMLASYPRVLEAQRKLYELQIEYLAALERFGQRHRAAGYLLTDGLEAPARPGEVDRPVARNHVQCRNVPSHVGPLDASAIAHLTQFAPA